MYTENNRTTSFDRANDDFLRRMLGGELRSDERAVLNQMEDVPQKPQFPGCVIEDGYGKREGVMHEDGEGRARNEDMPKCNDGDGDTCPKYMLMPSLAMVYAPHQCWQNLLDPESALEHGSQFAELILPFEAGRGGCTKMGGGKGRC